MSEKIVNINKEGDTDVKIEDDFSIQKAGVERSKKADWNDFELIGKSNKEEWEHVGTSESDPVKMEAALRKIQRSRFLGKSVLSALSSAA